MSFKDILLPLTAYSMSLVALTFGATSMISSYHDSSHSPKDSRIIAECGSHGIAYSGKVAMDANNKEGSVDPIHVRFIRSYGKRSYDVAIHEKGSGEWKSYVDDDVSHGLNPLYDTNRHFSVIIGTYTAAAEVVTNGEDNNVQRDTYFFHEEEGNKGYVEIVSARFNTVQGEKSALQSKPYVEKCQFVDMRRAY